MQHGAAAELLARVPVLRGIGGEFLSVIMQTGEPQRFTMHDTLAVSGMPADGAFVILEGQVALYTDDGRQFGDLLGPTDTVCEMAMIVETHHFFSAFGMSDGFALKFPYEPFGTLMRQYPWLAAHLARNIGQDLGATARTLHELDETLSASEAGLLPFVGERDEKDEDATETQDLDEADGAMPSVLRDKSRGEDLLVSLSEAISHSDRKTPEPEHGPMVSPSRALLQSLEDQPRIG